MARGTWGSCRLLSRKLGSSSHAVLSYRSTVVEKEGGTKKTSLALEKRDWESTVCSVCMEFPHNAVLLLCSSHDKGCRPYMCDTSYRYSNCLDQFKRAYAKEAFPHKSTVGPVSGSSDEMELMCPLCRGQVKGWTVVEPAREYLNGKKRSCVQDDCSFVGTYKRLRKHVRAEHVSAKPHRVDPVLEQKWKALEYSREREDVMSTIRSSMPRSVVLGDYVIDMDSSDSFDDDLFDEGEGLRWRNRRVSPISIVSAILREGSSLARARRDDRASEGRGVGGGHSRLMAAAAAAAAVPAGFASDEEDDYVSLGGSSRSDRRNVRRRRSYSRSLFGGS